MSEENELKPCPFCGGKAVSDTLQNESTVQCVNPDCDVIANVSGFGCDVDIDIWNTRPIEDALNATISGLEVDNFKLRAAVGHFEQLSNKYGMSMVEFYRELMDKTWRS